LAEVHNIPDQGGRDPEEKALAAGLAAGDPASVKDFLLRTHRPVYAMTARLTGDPDQRHDWCQDILLKILEEMAAGRFVYRRPGCFWAWFKIRVNFLLLNHYCQHKKHTDRWSAGEIGEAILDRIPVGKETSPLELVEAVEMRRVIEECLEDMASDDQRQALHLVLFQDLPYQDVADHMGATLNTVRSWIRRARIGMRRCVAEKMGYAEDA